MLTVLALLAAAPDAAADDALARARERFREGAALQAAGDWSRALDAFKDVALVKSSPSVRFNIAVCEEKLGDYVRAAGSYRLALTEATQSSSKDIEAAVQYALAELEPRIPLLTVRRGDGAAVAEVTLDGRPLGALSIGIAIQLNPGPHVVRATAPDREPFTAEFTLADRERKTLDLALRPKASAALAPIKPEPALRLDASQGTSRLGIAGFVVGGVGVAGLATSAILFGLRQKAISDLDAVCGTDHMHCPSSAKSTYENGGLYAASSTATFIAGLGAAAIGATLVLVSTRGKPSAPKPAAGFTITPGGATLFGTF